MPRRSMSSEVHLDVASGRERTPQAASPESSFRIALLGDFSGRANRGLLETGTAIAGRGVVPVDRDSFEEALAKAGAAVTIPFESPNGTKLSLHFKDIDDFHPDSLFQHASIFTKLRQLRSRLADPSTFLEAAQELGIAPAAGAPSEDREYLQNPRPAPSQPSRLASGSLLDEMIEQSESQPVYSHRPDDLQEFIRRVVTPH